MLRQACGRLAASTAGTVSRRLFSSATADKVYLVLGANSGVGSHLCSKLLASGSKLAVACRNPDSMAQLVQKLHAAGGSGDNLMSSQVDVTDPAQIEACVKEVLAKYGRVDGAVNCAGSIVLKPGHLTSEDEFNETLRINLNSSFSLLRSIARPMMKQKEGSIVFCSSAVAKLGLANHEAIAAAKAGVAGLALSAASTYSRYNVRVNVVSPGLTDTGIAARITGNEAALKASLAMHPLGKLGAPADVADAIFFLLGQSNITGQNLSVDGGLGSLK